MGSPANEPNRDRDEVQHQVTVSSFYMGKYEVTQKEWREVMGTTIQQQREKAGGSKLYGEGDNYPMYYISWFDAVEYCNKRSQREGLTPAYTVNGTNVTWNRNANGYRLPTEAEWEYAAKGGNGSPGNYTYAGSNNADGVAWYGNYSGNPTYVVGTKAANGLSLYDMSGNVNEWCWDWSGPYSSGAQADPVGASSGADRAIRGGYWTASEAEIVRSARRNGATPNLPLDFIGFRLVRNGN